jgi:hypothetical protein
MGWDRFVPFEVAFSVLDLDARLSFRTTSSISFDVEWNETDLEGKFRKGWIDVHYPCAGRVEVVIRISLNVPYPDWKSQKAIIDALLRVLGIPNKVTYEALFMSPAGSVEVVNDPNSWLCQ